MEQQTEIRITKWMVISIGVLLALILIGTGIVNLVQRINYQYEAVIINNYPSDLPKNISANIEIQLRRTLAMGLELPENEAVKGEVREDSIEFSSGGENIYNADFLVDIDEYKQTFWVSASWSTSPEVIVPDGIVILCPPITKMKYTGTKCVSAYNSSESIQLYLPYNGILPSGKTFSAKFDQYGEGGKEKVLIEVSSCGDASIQEEALKQVEEYFSSMGIELGDYVYEIPIWYENCIIN